MEILPISQFPHNELITESKINVSDFDENLRLVITDFNKKYDTYRRLKQENLLITLKALSTIIMQNIYDYYVDKTDQDVKIGAEPTKKVIKEVAKDIKEEIKGEGKTPEPVKEPVATPPVIAPPVIPPVVPPVVVEETEPTNKNELALFLLIKEKKTEAITIAMLKEKGFDVSSWGPLSMRGCNVGKYILYKRFSDTTFSLK